MSTLISVKKLEEARVILDSWPKSRFFNPVILSSLLNGWTSQLCYSHAGYIDGGYYKEAIELYDWCMENSVTPRWKTSLRTPMTVSSVIYAMEKTGNYKRLLDLYHVVRDEKGTMTPDVYFAVATVCDGSKLWRTRYNELIQTQEEYKDRRKYSCVLCFSSLDGKNCSRPSTSNNSTRACAPLRSANVCTDRRIGGSVRIRRVSVAIEDGAAEK